MPSDITNYGYINKLTYYEDIVNNQSGQNTAMADAFAKAKPIKKVEGAGNSATQSTNASISPSASNSNTQDGKLCSNIPFFLQVV